MSKTEGVRSWEQGKTVLSSCAGSRIAVGFDDLLFYPKQDQITNGGMEQDPLMIFWSLQEQAAMVWDLIPHPWMPLVIRLAYQTCSCANSLLTLAFMILFCSVWLLAPWGTPFGLLPISAPHPPEVPPLFLPPSLYLGFQHREAYVACLQVSMAKK